MTLQENYNLYIKIDSLSGIENVKTPYIRLILDDQKFATDVEWDETILIPLLDKGFEDKILQISLYKSKSFSKANLISTVQFPVKTLTNGELFDDFITFKDGEKELGKLKVVMQMETPFTLYLPPPTIPSRPPDCISLFIDHGERIVQKQIIGTQLVFCVITFLGVDYQTKEVLSSNVDPIWKSRIIIPVKKVIDYESDFIKIELATSNIVGATSLGSEIINLKKYVDGNLFEEKIEIRDQKGFLNGVIFGKIQLIYNTTIRRSSALTGDRAHKKTTNIDELMKKANEYQKDAQKIFRAHTLSSTSSSDGVDSLPLHEMVIIMQEVGMSKEDQDEWIKNAKTKSKDPKNLRFNYSEFLVWYLGMKQKKGDNIPIANNLPNTTTCPSCQFTCPTPSGVASFECPVCHDKIYSPILNAAQMIQDLSENKGQIIICKMLLEEWFDAIDTLGNGVLDEFDGIKLFTALHFPDPKSAWSKMMILNKLRPDEGISKKQWIDYTFSMLDKDSMGIPTDQSINTIKGEIVKIKSILCRWTCTNCNTINNQKDNVCPKCGEPSPLPSDKGKMYFGRMITNDHEIGSQDIKMEIQRSDTTIQGKYWAKAVDAPNFGEPLSLVGFVETNGTLSMKLYEGNNHLGYINGTFSGNTIKFVYADSCGLNGTGTVNSINKSDGLELPVSTEANSKACVIF